MTYSTLSNRLYSFSLLAMTVLGTAACADVPEESDDLDVGSVASDYTTEPNMRPTNLTINLVTKSQPIHNNFTRYVTLQDHQGNQKDVAVAFSRTSSLHYTGIVTAEGLSELQTIVDENNRSYWDTMYFENHGGSTPLDIDEMEIWIEYANHAGEWEPDMMIGYSSDEYLDAGTDSFSVSAYTGRRLFAQDYLGWTSTEFYSVPLALRYFLYDLGKGGSENDYPNTTNPKYAASGQNLCSETVSWYYYERGVSLPGQNFRDITDHNQMHDAFLNAGRLYCYHLSAQEWVLRDQNYDWVRDGQGNYVTYDPQPGDYLDRRNGHAMMMIEWTPRSGSTGGIATVIDGPYPVAFREVPVHDHEADGVDFCVGKIPEND